MTNRFWIVALALALPACGRVADLEPAAGKSLPQKPALASRPLTSEELLALPTQADPERIDELGKRGEPRKPDPFDLPPPDGAAIPPPVGAEQPSPSTTGPENQDPPR